LVGFLGALVGFGGLQRGFRGLQRASEGPSPSISRQINKRLKETVIKELLPSPGYSACSGSSG